MKKIRKKLRKKVSSVRKKIKRPLKKRGKSTKKIRSRLKKKGLSANRLKKRLEKERYIKELKKQFKKKVLAISSSIQEWEVKNYTAYRIKKGATFLRIHKKKTNLALSIKSIKVPDRKKFNLRDNSSRVGHELTTRGSRFSEKHLSANFIKLVKLAFKHVKGK